MPYFKLNLEMLYFLLSQFTRLPPPLKNGPTNPIEGKVVILTGANSGIGLSAAHELAELRPSKLILAVRSIASGADVVQSILKLNPKLDVEVWDLDLAKYASVKAFAKRAEGLGHVDVAFLNAGINPGRTPSPIPLTEDGHETVAQVNVLSTILLAVLLEPMLAKSSSPKLVITTSEVHAWADPSIVANAVKADSGIIAAYDDPKVYVTAKRYTESKLLLQLIVRQLIPAMPHITIASVNPGLCGSNLIRNFQMKWNLASLVWMGWYSFWTRPTEHGARAILSASAADDSAEYWHLCKADFAPAAFMATARGNKASKLVWEEMKEELERVSPGSTASLQ